MQLSDAKLRHRELTQEVYDIGDEVAEYIEHLVEAIIDFDAELVEDCMAEFDEIVAEARSDSRVVVAELMGVRQALISGVRAGTVSAGRQVVTPTVQQPEQVDAARLMEQYPLADDPVDVAALSVALHGRTEMVQEYLTALVEWVLDATAVAASDLHAVSLPQLYSRVHRGVHAAVAGWKETVAQRHRPFARAMRGSNPPQFLNERARIDAIVNRVRRKLQAAN